MVSGAENYWRHVSLLCVHLSKSTKRLKEVPPKFERRLKIETSANNTNTHTPHLLIEPHDFGLFKPRREASVEGSSASLGCRRVAERVCHLLRTPCTSHLSTKLSSSKE